MNKELSAIFSCSLMMIGLVIVLVLTSQGKLNPSTSSPEQTYQEMLDEHHKNGKYLGYKNGNIWAKDMEAMNGN